MSKRCELMKLHHTNLRVWFFEAQCI